MELFKFITYWANENPGKAVGAFLGFLLGLLILTMGLLGTVLIILLVILGVILGKISDDNVPFIEEIKNFFRRK